MKISVKAIDFGANNQFYLHTPKRTKMDYKSISLTGGRSSVSGLIATVYGCTGFLGRYVVSHLGRCGTQVVVPYRGEEKCYNHLKVMGDLGQIVPMKWDIRDKDSVQRAAKYSHVIINLTGQKYDTRNFTVYDVNVDGARRIAQVAKEANVDRFFHISALGASPDAKSDYLKSKWEGEEAVRKTFPKATIFRPAVLFGAEDNFLIRNAQMLRYWPAVPIVHPEKVVQPIWVNDVALAIMNALKSPETEGKTYELAGSQAYSTQEIFNWIATVLKVEKPVFEPPESLTWHMGYWLGQNRNPRFTLDSIKESESVLPSGKYPGMKELGLEPLPLNSPRATGFVIPYRLPIRMGDVSFDLKEEPTEISPIGIPSSH